MVVRFIVGWSVLIVSGCAEAPGKATEPVTRGDAVELQADVCELTRTFSRVLAGGEGSPRTDVLLARADAWYDLAYAYDTAKSELERCIDPALKATFLHGAEVWPGRPPISAVKKFSGLSGFFEENASMIALETITNGTGAELRLQLK